jgi:hypothetical protein
MKQVRCDHCGTLYASDRTDCKNCGAPYQDKPIKEVDAGWQYAGYVTDTGCYSNWYGGYVNYGSGQLVARGFTVGSAYIVTSNDDPEKYHNTDYSNPPDPKPNPNAVIDIFDGGKHQLPHESWLDKIKHAAQYIGRLTEIIPYF